MAINIHATLPDRLVELDARLRRTLELGGLIDDLAVKYEVSARYGLALRELVRAVQLRRRARGAASRAALQSGVSAPVKRACAAVQTRPTATAALRTAKRSVAVLRRNMLDLSGYATLLAVKYRRLREMDPSSLFELDGQTLATLGRVTIAD